VDALDVMYGLVLENGKEWGVVAATFQRADADAIFAENGPRLHFLTRGRGGSKTTDVAGVCIAWLLAEAPPLANAYVVAANTEQATILIDAMTALIGATPGLDEALTVEAERIRGANGATVRVMAQSDSGSWGRRDTHLLILDEFAQWPETRGAKRVYQAVRTTVQKTPGCRLIILTSAGEPSHWSHGILEMAKEDSGWRVYEAPGPVPWQSKAEIERLRREFAKTDPSAFDRLVLNKWTEAEDRAIRVEDYDAAKGRPSRGPIPDVKYLILVDIGIRNDATVMTIAHAEPLDAENPRGAKRLIVDHIERWKGTRSKPVQIQAVEDWLARTAPKWNRATVYGDPTQFVGAMQNLNRRGVRAVEFPFTTTSVGQVAAALVMAFRNRQITVPHTPALREELLRVRLRETTPGVTRLDHDPNGHDDQAVTIGMAAHILLAGSYSHGEAFLEYLRKDLEKTAAGGNPDRFRNPSLGRLQHAQRLARQSAACDHRWRGDRCVMCPATRTPEPATT
jgi:hypothetical protein